ncbi:MAG: prephenate dehydratase domain-containing protein [Acidobacteriota bacterium]
MPMRVAIQGEKGAYSECAALDFFLKGSIVPCRDYVDLFTAVDKGQADCMVIPIENSAPLNHTLDAVQRARLRRYTAT